METKSESSRIALRIAHDRLTAWIRVRAGRPLGESELRDALTQASVTSGIDSATFERLVLGLADSAFECSEEVIARGLLPQAGEHGRFDALFRGGIQPGHVREDGTIDFHDRELLKPVQAGHVIGQVRPARQGTEGYLVDGTRLVPAPVKEVVLALGPGVSRDADGVVRAARAGVLISKTAESLDVIDHHVHEGPVDLRSGHLHMQGSLVVKGDVQRSFSVYATGDVEIRGSVDSGNVSAGGNVRIQYGVRGGDGGTVYAEGNLSVHHAESATLCAGRLLQITEAVHTQLSAGRVEVAGRLRGGQASAEFSIIAHELGSPHGAETELAVAEPLELPIESAQRALERAKALRTRNLGTAGRANPGERAKGGKLGRVQATLDSAETERLAQRAQRREMLSRIAFIQFAIAHPGVTIRIADQKVLIDSETRAARYSIDGETRELRKDRVPP